MEVHKKRASEPTSLINLPVKTSIRRWIDFCMTEIFLDLRHSQQALNLGSPANIIAKNVRLIKKVKIPWDHDERLASTVI